MSNLIYPDLIGATFDVSWQPRFTTKIQAAVSGKEYRISQMANPIYQLTLNYEFLRHGRFNELRTLFGFFLQMRGAFDSFLFRHPDDCSVVDQLISNANGTGNTFQLVRSFGSVFSEPVQNVDVVTAVKVNGVARTDYVLSDTGVLTFTSAVSGAITWSGSYFYRARFSVDEQEFKKFMKDLWTTKTVTLQASLGRKI